jgi:hypothetical protein
MNEYHDVGIFMQLLSREETLTVGLSGIGLVTALFLKMQKFS